MDFPDNKARALCLKMADISECWLYMRCACDRTRWSKVGHYLKYGNTTLSEFMGKLKCPACKRGPVEAKLQAYQHMLPYETSDDKGLDLI